jgi:chromatin assembly factor 1 subunit A
MADVDPQAVKIDDGSDVEMIDEISFSSQPLQSSHALKSSQTGAEDAKKSTTRQLEKLKEKEERERKRKEEKLAREKAKEEERKLKEEKKVQKELEKKKKEEEREKVKRENDLKKEQLKKEKEEKEKRKQEEKEEKERKKQEEKQKKEEEKRQKEEEKRLKEEQEKKRKDKLKISNFFKPKITVKSTIHPTKKDTDAYQKSFQPFFIRDGVTVYNPVPEMNSLQQSIDEFDLGLKSGESDLNQWFQSQPHLKPGFQQSAQYIFEHQLGSAPIHVKFIKFYENLKSWNGTYTKDTKGLGKDPLRELPFFIDFDDDVGEDEEGDGEDIDDDEDEEEEEDEDADEMDDFLEEDKAEQKRKILGPLIPVITWGKEQSQEIKLEILKAEVSFPVDPLFDYWKPVPRDSEDSSQPQKKQKTVITDRSALEKFAEKVHDCDFTVPTMVEILKKELPMYTKATIENTLRSLAKRVGAKQAEKKWQVDQELLEKVVES